MPSDDRTLEPRVDVGALRDQHADDVGGVERVHELRRRPAEHGPHRVHVHGGIERCGSRAVRYVGIGAFLDEHRRRVEMGIRDRIHERRRPVRVGGVEVGLGIGQRGHGIGGAVTRGVHQRRPAAARQHGDDHAGGLPLEFRKAQELAALILVRAEVDQRFDRRRVVLRRRPHQGGLPLPVLLGVDLRSVRHEHLDGVRAAGARRRHQHGFTLGQGAVRIGSRLEQRVHQRRVAVLGRQNNRREAVAGHRFGVGPCAQQHLHGRDVVGADRPVQRRHAVGFGHVHVRVLANQRAHRGEVPLLDGIDHSNAAAGGSQAGH